MRSVRFGQRVLTNLYTNRVPLEMAIFTLRTMKLRRLVSRPWLSCAALLAAFAVAGSAHAETLSAEDAVARAATQNPTLHAALLDVTAAHQAVDAEQGARNATLVASASAGYSEKLHTGAAAARTDDKSVSSQVALKYTTDIGTQLEVGTTADASWSGGPLSSIAADASTDALYTGSGYVTVRQPLLRGAGTDAVLAPLAQAKSSAVATERDRDQVASETALDVLSAYWELWYADQSVQVQKDALAVAQKQVADAKTRADTLGTGSQVDVLQFSTSAASIADALSQAQATRSTRAIELGRLVGVDPAASASLDAEGTPPALGDAPSAASIAQAVLDHSPELAALRAQLDVARSRVGVAEDANQPRLDVFATASAGALWANDTLPGLALPGGRPAYSIVGGVDFELPFGGGRASSDAARAQTELLASQARYEAREDALTAEASSLRISLDAAAEQVNLATETARSAAALSDAEHQRLALGTTTSADVVKAEQTLREAELRQRRAVVNQVTSRFELEHATGALLDRFAGSLGRLS
jgi:outer membrane protein